MALKDFLQEINEDVADVINTEYKLFLTDAAVVPSYEDANLTFDYGETKKGKTIETCVLFIDIRKSTELNMKHNVQTLAKLYSAFINVMVRAAGYYEGVVRNIIGDRIMVVFPPKDCHKNAIDTAVLFNTISTKMLNKHFIYNDVKFGIGIDYGKMVVIKAGIAKYGKERAAYKGLVWVGKPANIASKLTDNANKSITNKKFKVTYMGLPHPLLSPHILSTILGIRHIEPATDFTPPKKVLVTEEVDEKTFLENITWNSYSKLNFKYGEVQNLEIREEKITTSPILITEEVFKVYSRLYPEADAVKKKWWADQNIQVSPYNGKIYGASLYNSAIDEIKL